MKSVGTHNGYFHADEVFAIAILELVFGELEIIRTRDESLYSKCDFRVDVGNKYDNETKDYDHHQKEGAGIRESEIRYASAGLVWLNYGLNLVNSEDELNYIDKKIISGIDASDNGQNIVEKELGYPYTISDVISSFNPNWEEENPDFDKNFKCALEFAKDLLKKEIKKAKSLTRAKEIVINSIKNSEDKYLILEKTCPWQKIVIENSDADYVIYESPTKEWLIQCVPDKENSFNSKKPFPNSWAGLRNKDFEKIAGVENLIFCHRNRFIAGAKTKKSAIKLVEIALKN